uniref:Uncharacterized protein n=1 Tax=Zea mays TaxID=4577 RepID=A0A804NKC4_MAIZE
MVDNVVVAVAVVVLLVVVSKLKSLLSSKPKLHLPPGPWTLPVIGSLHHLIGGPLIHRTLRRLSQKHGPLMMLRLGEVPMVIASSPEAAEEILKTHDTAFADRFTSGQRQHGRDDSFRRIRQEEVARLVATVAAAAAVRSSVDMSARVKTFVYDTIMRECVGSRSRHQDGYLDAFHMAVRQTSGGAIHRRPVPVV